MPQETRPQPNIVLVFADQLRSSAVGYNGNPDVRTPVMNHLAADGVVFTSAVAGCPVCTPYRACLLTGRYPLSHGLFMNDVRLPESERTFGEIYSAADYDTAYIGKWHLDGNQRLAYTPPGPRRHGFGFWAVGNCTHDYFHSLYYCDTPEPLYWEGYDAHAQARLACDYIRSRDPQRPYCLFLSWGPPHNPFEWVPQNYLDMYAPDALHIPPNTPKPVRRDLAGYYAHITALDEALGWVLEAIRASGQEENTIVVFTSDHGEMLGAQGYNRKQLPWDDSVLVPLIVRYPAAQRPACRVDVPINAPDLLPTLLSLCRLTIPAEVEGTDLAHLVTGTEGTAPDSALIEVIAPFSEYTGPEWRGVRTNRYTYARTLEGPWILYDNLIDPYQVHNLVGDPAYNALQAEMEAKLQGWLERTNDTFEPAATYRERFGHVDIDERNAIRYTP
ncbi:MAG: sulfatase [Chloroflexi bacterium]|nr:sulfatase [Chloroflexota bacterium]